VAPTYLIANPTNATVNLTTTPARTLAPRATAGLLVSAAEATTVTNCLAAGCAVTTVGEPAEADKWPTSLAGLDQLKVAAAQALIGGVLP
jgi:hypothetical protein